MAEWLVSFFSCCGCEEGFFFDELKYFIKDKGFTILIRLPKKVLLFLLPLGVVDGVGMLDKEPAEILLGCKPFCG